MTTIKYITNHRKLRFELVDEQKKHLNRIFINK